MTENSNLNEKSQRDVDRDVDFAIKIIYCD